MPLKWRSGVCFRSARSGTARAGQHRHAKKLIRCQRQSYHDGHTLTVEWFLLEETQAGPTVGKWCPAHGQ